MSETGPEALEAIAARAATAAPLWAASSPRMRARGLATIAERLNANAVDLVSTARRETGLTEQRLSGELKRTVVQLRLFAEVVLDGAYLDVRIDNADSDFVLGVRPDVRRYRIPLGPVLNFAASNFPFAFSVAGGDTASALAAGCPVILKTHSGHPRLSAQTAELVSSALEAAGAPAGTFQVVSGQKSGVAMLKDRRVAAGSFTGSIRVGRLLADIAASRPKPIPFFGELGSVNPTFVTQSALEQDAESITDGYLSSIAGSAGQLCTKPGFLFLPVDYHIKEDLKQKAADVPEQRLLNPSITAGYRARRDAILATPGVSVVAEGSLRVDQDGQGWARPTIVKVQARTLQLQRATLLEEAFGPLSIIVEYEKEADLVQVADDLFEGNLTGTVHAATGEDTRQLRSLVPWIAEHSGRILFGGWPTGVAVTPAMQHGGPWPATTNDSSTSVGTAAIDRFLRPVAYQNVPEALLPEPLRDDNPWGIPQSRNLAGQSRFWGALALTETTK